MARYIDADALESELFRDGIAGIFLNYPRRIKFTIGEIRGMLKNERIAPTADVVPRSEVEALEREIDRLKYILRSYALQYGTVMGQQKVIDEIKREVAREIFEEMDILGTYNPTIYAELKKKYMEGGSHEDL